MQRLHVERPVLHNLYFSETVRFFDLSGKHFHHSIHLYQKSYQDMFTQTLQSVWTIRSPADPFDASSSPARLESPPSLNPLHKRDRTYYAGIPSCSVHTLVRDLPMHGEEKPLIFIHTGRLPMEIVKQ